jgi:hypothetical protein
VAVRSYGWALPVEFLSDQEAAAFGRYGGSVSQADLERFFYLDDADRKLVAGQREDHNRLGFSVQLTTVRYIGRFLADPLEGVPAEVIDFLAGQLQIADPSCVKRYAQRQQTHREHAAKIRQTLGLKDFTEVEAELAVFAGRRAWVTGDGPKAIFADAVGWLRDRDVLLPGVSRLARLVARERDAATQRLWETLHAALTGPQRLALDALLAVPPGARVSELERWRTGPARASGPQMVKALNRVAEIIGSGLSRVQLDASVTPRRLAELARYGMGTDAAHLKRHGDQRRLATLVATVTQLEATATDDALELLELLMATELAGRARQEAGKETIKRHPRLAWASATLAVVAQVLLEARDWGHRSGGAGLGGVGGDRGADSPRGGAGRGGHRDRDAAAARSPARAGLAGGAGQEDRHGGGPVQDAHRHYYLRRQRPGRPGAGGDDRAGRAAGHRHQVDHREPAHPPAGGDRAVEAPGVRPPRPRRRDGGPRRLHLLRAGAVLPPPETPGHLRRDLDAVPQPPSAAAGR